MSYTDGYGQNMYDGNINIDITNQNVNDNTNMNMMGYDPMGSTSMMGTVTSPVVEPGRERVVYRNIYHTVPQYCPFMVYVYEI